MLKSLEDWILYLIVSLSPTIRFSLFKKFFKEKTHCWLSGFDVSFPDTSYLFGANLITLLFFITLYVSGFVKSITNSLGSLSGVG